MGSIDFEGRRVPTEDGDTIASALFRAGVRTFSRSLKYHRRRGLYCMSGDCPNCLVIVDGEPGHRSCTTRARDGQRVRRSSGWPSTDRDLLSIADHLHPLLPVGFYSKTFIRPRSAWPIAERVIRRATGIGPLPVSAPPRRSAVRHVRPDLLVLGGGVAGLSAAIAAAEDGADVMIVDEGRVAEALPPGPAAERAGALAAIVRADPRITLAEDHVAVGIYEGPFVAVVGPERTLRIEPDRIVVATGAVEVHGVFAGNDLPGVWLGRGAARLVGVHGLRPGSRAVLVAGTPEAFEHLSLLRAVGVEVAAVLAPGPLIDAHRGVDALVLRDARVLGARGRRGLEQVRVGTSDGERTIACDTLVLSLGLWPRDDLLRMVDGIPVRAAGDVRRPGCTVDEAEADGQAAGAGHPATGLPTEPPIGCAGLGPGGTVCLCEDVGLGDLETAWGEGWQSSEILKRYTTATMGPCQGAMCGRHLACFATARSGGDAEGAGRRTTARPPARPVRLEQLAAGVEEVIEKRTSLHDEHLAAGARVTWSGSWQRPTSYGDVREEYLAVRERVGIIDVGTLGKFLIAGPDATTLVDRVFPCRIDTLRAGRSRYALALDEAGYVFDDGLVCRIGPSRYVVTSTSGGADRMEMWLRSWADRLGLRVYVVNRTALLGAILVAGPHTRGVLDGLTDDPLDSDSLPHMAHARITVAGVPVRAIRTGFEGELGLELHHERSRGPELWRALLRAGASFELRPHGLDALDLLRLEKGHLFLGQDTLPDDHPDKLGLGWSVAVDKGPFVGRAAIRRLVEIELDRRLVGLGFDGVPRRGVPLRFEERVVGRVTSCAVSPVLGRGVGLGWVRKVDGAFPEVVRAGEVIARVEPIPFYDPEGARIVG
jgi:sarcosine oxidase subunit alpha